VPTILVADDNSNIQKMVSLVFEEKGFRVVAVGNGEAACRKMSEVRPDIVLADVFMPVRNGYEVCEFVKQDSQFAGIPVILLVGAFDPLDEKEAHRVGADGVLKKPFVPPDPLIAMVTSLLPKIEPVVEPPPVPKEEIPEPPAWIPKPRPPIPVYEEPEGVPPEFAFGTAASRDFEPVATPTAKHADEETDDEEPASEWKRRRSTVEYDIPAAESANMVEKLASEEPAPDLASLDTVEAKRNANVPFGGANVPEESPSSPSSASTKWIDLMGSLETTQVEPVEESHEVSHLADEDHSISSHLDEPSNGSSTRPSAAKTEDAPSDAPHEEPLNKDSEPPSVAAQQTEWPAPPAEVIAFRLPAESSSTSALAISNEKTTAETPAAENQEVSPYAAEAPRESGMESEELVVEKSHEIPVEASAPPPVTHEKAYEERPADIPETPRTPYAANAIAENTISEAGPADPAKFAETDAAMVDDVVAKLLEKLEPQIQQALSSAALRPLVEEILQREREKK